MIYIESSQVVEEELKMEIIRRTDTFFLNLYHGNNHKFNRELYILSGVPANFDMLDLDHSCQDMNYSYINTSSNSILTKFHVYDDWLYNQWGSLRIKYLKNQWISNPLLTGWINPETGKIGGIAAGSECFDPVEVEEDLRIIAKEWPSLRFTATLYDPISLYIFGKWQVYEGYVTKDIFPETLNKEPVNCMSFDDILKKNGIDGVENYWTLDELKKLWFKKLFCVPSKYYIKRDGRFLCVFIPDGGIDSFGDFTGNIYNLRRRASLKRIKLSWKNLMKYRVNAGTSYSMKPDKEGYEGPYPIFWK